jgi:hypothetical protein
MRRSLISEKLTGWDEGYTVSGIPVGFEFFRRTRFNNPVVSAELWKTVAWVGRVLAK